MGSRTSLALLALFLLLGASAFWLFAKGGAGRGDGASGARGIEADAGVAVQGAEAPLAPNAPSRSGTDQEVARREVEGTPAFPEERAAPETDRGRVRLEGRVVDPLGTPIVGAEVLALASDGFPVSFSYGSLFGQGHEATTDARGRFAIEGLPGGRIGLRVLAAGYAPYERRDMVLPTDEVFRMETIRMEPGAILSGFVLDPDGRPVSGAELRFIDPGQALGALAVLQREPLAVTGEDGAFRLDRIPLGTWGIHVHSEEHPNKRFEGLTETPGEEVAGLRFVLPYGEHIEGHASGLPEGLWRDLEVVAVRVGVDWSSFDPRRAPLAEDGAFVLRGVIPKEEYELRLSAKSKDAWMSWETFSKTITAFAGTSGVEIPYQAESALVFRVVDSKTLQPIEDFEVRAGIDWTAPMKNEDGSIATHHPGGRARFGDLRPEDARDRAQLEIRAAGYGDFARESIALIAGQELDLGDLLLDPVPVLRVNVVDGATGAPIAGAKVALELEDRFGEGGGFEMTVGDGPGSWRQGRMRVATTDSSGLALLSIPEGEVVDLTVRAVGYAVFEEQGLALPRGESVDRTVVLGRGGEVVVRVMDPEGQPVAGAQVLHRGVGEQGPSFGNPFGGGGEVTDSSGEVVFEHLAPGRHEFRVSDGRSGGRLFSMGGSAFV
ncbi:MAG TPA: carboxypeptidase regulatory-like domain-containing protein, partial [Planctomycetes bacterium]|nr:carboxypeptidase regulatory-like domain-containing protein [Planctomycetota bacterium]